ncbi:Dna2/Cas4 domain-containing protein [Rhodobacteraceae bacterium 2376]|uniref:Dna2/Cas4 domain-containing protein n=1 Tax=Rhabdonatronobacter sediminivivens TaxID=2743469 RepID=A0A7Z0I1W0_9RHOB|nr:Dna2/Cas4 domain-containing protein [Rhabdonatronobacter sediminivivens]NYS26388.1 Dna2/Cas4 domain-containing protein [Rhabdonatronobacter sediminivivens]
MAQPSSSDLGAWRESVMRFRDLVQEGDLHGLLFQHLDLCTRRAWLHLHRIDYAHLEERMRKGSVGHDLHKARDRSVEGLMGLAPDRINWEKAEVIEVKGSVGARSAVSSQTRFYALLLMAATGRKWTAANEITGGRKHLPVLIDRADIDAMNDMAERLVTLAGEPVAPPAGRKPICGSCSYRMLCGY